MTAIDFNRTRLISSARTVVSFFCVLALLGGLGLPIAAQAQAPAPAESRQLQFRPQQIIPITRPFLHDHSRRTRPVNQPVVVTQVDARITVNDQMATTQLDISLHNPNNRQIESEVIIPVAEGSVFRGFTFEGTGLEASAKILPRAEARRIYESIVAQTKDPALLEFIGTDMLQSSVFPVPANGRQKVRVTFDRLLPIDGTRIDYVLPRSETLEYRIPWNIDLDVKSTEPIASLYSPSHELNLQRISDRHIAAKISATTQPGAFLFSMLRQKGDAMTASLVAYPDPKISGGYFMVLVAPPAPNKDLPPMKREVTVVIDRSGSMAGEKLEQVRAAALQVLEGLDDGEAFNIIVYNESVESFSPQPVVKDAATMKQVRTYLTALRVSGGTNIHDAIVEALRQKPTEGTLPIVLFLTDGLPTIGQTSEKAIREVAAKGNPHSRRIFTFGVGVDVNTPLLSRLARESRAVATYVLPKEDVEVKVGQVYRRLAGPVLAEPKISIVDQAGHPVSARVTDLLPATLPDIFQGEQVVLLGKYIGSQPVRFQLTGRDRSGPRTFNFDFKFDKATTANSFVPRLWASNKIGVLAEAIRDIGADAGGFAAAPIPKNDPRVRELVNEIVRLSQEFGILTEYTAFLAEEGTNLADAGANRGQASDNFRRRALGKRWGAESLNQEFNTKAWTEKKSLNRTNQFWDENLKEVEITQVQQLNDRAYFKRGDLWVDSQLGEGTSAATTPDRVVEIGSTEFNQLVDKLATGNRLGCFALKGQLLLNVDGQTVLVK
ncbi:MAG: Ca-activated chloride channel family protein [Verrucomicrobiales bacterium]|jgi:Ca-activated chloride channel family protein